MNAAANYVFLPWVRQGAASGIETPDSLSANQTGVVSVPVKLRINESDPAIDQQVRLYGPGDVTGIDPQQVVRTEPRHLATDFEPNYFPFIEFDRPDFPWLFTPAKADDKGRLRPWLCLIVVQKQQGVTLISDRNLPLPVLEIKEPARTERELPDLSESWAWAHAQVTGSQRDSDSLKKSLAGDPALTVSRLMCPRRLDPSTEYLACVVPAFELGRKAGLGDSADEQKLETAWISGAQSPPEVKLPVYYHWEFGTGTGGDFESLVRSLVARDLSEIEDIGKRPMDITQPGFETTPPLSSLSSGTTLQLEGALRVWTPPRPVHDPPPVDWPEVSRTPFQTALKDILEAPEQAMQEGKEALLAPPIYGCWQAARHTVETPPSASTPWLDELNLDPRHRASAALGTKVVQSQQEQLMAAAWEQLGEIQRINQMLRQAQLARAANTIYHSKCFSRFAEETLLKVVAPARSRVVIKTTDNRRALLAQRISKSAIPARALSAPLRRLTSPRGVISSRFPTDRPLPINIVAKLNTTSIVQPQKKEAGLVTINEVSDDPVGAFAGPLKQAIRFENVGNALDATPSLGDFKIVPEGAPKRTLLDFTPGLPADSPDAQAFRNAAKEHYGYLQKAFLTPTAIPVLVRMDLVGTKAQVLESVNPERTISARVQASLVIAGGKDSRPDSLEPIMDAPDFPQPMYEALRDLSQDFLLPGLEHVLPNTVAVLETNAKFIESFLVGLNVEMSRELLWRDYPTDQRGTYFRQFWETLADTDERDIPAITEWDDRKLGDNVHTGEKVVLLLRGELLRRYPNSVIYAVKAKKTGEQLDLSAELGDERHPLFRGTLKPDVTFLGFPLTRDQATGDESLSDYGWFFVIQQQPTEPRFGLDAADFTEPLLELKTWNDLSWQHLAKSADELKALSYASIKTVLPVIDNVEWGKNSAHQAYSTLQRPVRIAIHARQMIPQK
jgi:hypothetical protein